MGEISAFHGRMLLSILQTISSTTTAHCLVFQNYHKDFEVSITNSAVVSSAL